jgi:hypothetical protein
MNNITVNLTETPFYHGTNYRALDSTLLTFDTSCWNSYAAIGIIVCMFLVAVVWYYLRGGIK